MDKTAELNARIASLEEKVKELQQINARQKIVIDELIEAEAPMPSGQEEN